MMQQLTRNRRVIGPKGGRVASVICSGEPRIDTFRLGTDTLLRACLAAGRSARGVYPLERQGQMPERRAPRPYQYVVVARTKRLAIEIRGWTYGVATGLGVFSAMRRLACWMRSSLAELARPCSRKRWSSLSLDGSISSEWSQASRASNTFCCFK
jgi:hypothetical protein